MSKSAADIMEAAAAKLEAAITGPKPPKKPGEPDEPEEKSGFDGEPEPEIPDETYLDEMKFRQNWEGATAGAKCPKCGGGSINRFKQGAKNKCECIDCGKMFF